MKKQSKGKEQKNGIFKIYPEHILPYTDDQNNEILNEKGEVMPSLDIWSYSCYFADNIQNYAEIPNDKVDGCSIRLYDGVSINKFGELFYTDYIKDWRNFLLKDEKSYEFQLAMEEQFNVHVNVAALAVLCYFIKTIVINKKVLKLNPTIEDTIDSISRLKSVTFSNVDGSEHTTYHQTLLTTIINALKEQKEKQESNEYTTYKLVEREEVFTKEIMQAEFVIYLSEFLHEYFKIPRRKNCIISRIEQEIVMYYLSRFDLAPKGVTLSRFRQLINIDQSKLFNYRICSFPLGANGERVYEYLEVVKYKNWGKGKINVLKDKLEDLEPGDSINITTL